MQIKGIDVSHWQGAVDWKAVAAAGNAFAYTKATQGIGGADSTFAANWRGIAGAGLKRGAYHFFDPAHTGASQAQAFIRAIREVNITDVVLKPGDLPVMLDLEGTTGNLPPSAYIAAMRDFLAAVDSATGRPCGIYTGTSFWNHATAFSGAFSARPLWIAEYPAHITQAFQPPLPAGWRAWTFWQQTGKGRSPGVGTAAHPVDCDVDVFNGTAAELAALAGMTS